MRKKSMLLKLALWMTLELGALIGVPIRPDELERLMRTANQTKIVCTTPDDAKRKTDSN